MILERWNGYKNTTLIADIHPFLWGLELTAGQAFAKEFTFTLRIGPLFFRLEYGWWVPDD
jgi:hypothetical protein